MPTPQGNFDCNISDKDITPRSAAELLSMTRCYPQDQKMSPARIYDQCVPDPVCQDNLSETQNTGFDCRVNDGLGDQATD